MVGNHMETKSAQSIRAIREQMSAVVMEVIAEAVARSGMPVTGTRKPGRQFA